MTEPEARQQLLRLLRMIDKPDDWKITLDLSNENNVRIVFLKKNSVSITIFHKTYNLFTSWVFVREVQESTYEDLVLKLEKYPKLLETYREIRNDLAD